MRTHVDVCRLVCLSLDHALAVASPRPHAQSGIHQRLDRRVRIRRELVSDQKVYRIWRKLGKMARSVGCGLAEVGATPSVDR